MTRVLGFMVVVVFSACPPAVVTPEADAGEEVPDAGISSCDTTRFTDTSFGVLDSTTGTEWARWSEPERYATSADGEARCAEQGARLPTRRELEALLEGDGGDGVCPLDACAFDGVRCETFLTGTTNAAAGVGWAVDTLTGQSIAGDMGPYVVRCVRSHGE